MKALKGTTNPKVFEALAFAIEKHSGQIRKYTNEPYIIHPMGVAEMVANYVTNLVPGASGRDDLVMAALLHDVVEDCGVLLPEIGERFGKKVQELVFWLTAPSKGLPTGEGGYKRPQRKAIDHAFLAMATPDALLIKCCDILHNGETIMLNDRGFGPVYIQEVYHLVQMIRPRLEQEGHPVYTSALHDLENFLRENEIR